MSKNKEYIELGWKLLKYKLMYYRPELVDESWHEDLTISDSSYDLLEKEYSALAEELGLPNTIKDMVDFDEERPSAQLVMSRYRDRKPLYKKEKLNED